MFYYFTSHNKKCICCKCNLFILLDGYTICSHCGLILESKTGEIDFTPAGYYIPFRRKKESKQRKKEKFKKYYRQKYKKRGSKGVQKLPLK